MVAIVVAPFFAAIIIATWSGGRGGRSSAEPLGTWSTWLIWSELGGAARDVIDVVRGRCGCSISSVVGAQQRAESWRSLTKSRARVEVVGVNPIGVEVKKHRSRTVFLGRSAWPRRPLVETWIKTACLYDPWSSYAWCCRCTCMQAFMYEYIQLLIACMPDWVMS